MKAIALAATIATLSTPAAAQMQCLDYEALPRILANEFGEHAIGSGWRPTPNGIVIVEMYASDGGSWTLVMVQPDGQACILASGQGWRDEAGGEPA